MKKLFQGVMLSVLLTLGTGCAGDTVPVMIRQGVTLQNEVIDEVIYITDEESAAFVMERKIPPLKDKWSKICNRCKDLVDNLEEDEKEELFELFIDYLDELGEVNLRWSQQIERLRTIRHKLYLEKYGHIQPLPVVDLKTEWPNLTEALELDKSFDFSNISQDNPFLKSPTGEGEDDFDMNGMP